MGNGRVVKWTAVKCSVRKWSKGKGNVVKWGLVKWTIVKCIEV